MRYGLMKESLFYLLICLGNFHQKGTSIALQLHVFVLQIHMMIFMIQIFTHICLVVALSFIKLCDPSEMPFILVWSRSCALHQLNFYTGSQLCHSIHPQNKTLCLMISLSLSSIFQMKHGLSKKKMACPRSMTQKKEKNGHINVHKKRKRRNKKIYIAMPSCYPNKGERDS